MTLTIERLQLLQAIDKLGKKSEFNVAQIKELIAYMKKERGAVAKMVTKLKQDGFTENPMYGCWRLTKRGREALKEFIANGGNI